MVIEVCFFLQNHRSPSAWIGAFWDFNIDYHHFFATCVWYVLSWKTALVCSWLEWMVGPDFLVYMKKANYIYEWSYACTASNTHCDSNFCSGNCGFLILAVDWIFWPKRSLIRWLQKFFPSLGVFFYYYF